MWACIILLQVSIIWLISRIIPIIGMVP